MIPYETRPLQKALILRRIRDEAQAAYRWYVSTLTLVGTQKHAFGEGLET